ncbi:MAG: PLP-dependent aspartate aminotransferase family protein [Holophaga sp.]|nr:PLP-dependent aspartate aminotransferase family protein [Holophaga sp.]
MKNGMMTKLTHMGAKIDMPGTSTPKVPALHMNAAYCFEDAETLAAVNRNELPGYLYGRTSNPTNDCLREILTAIDEGAASQVYATGMGAISMAVISNIKAGDHILVNKVVFGTSYKFFRAEMHDKFGVEVSFVDFQQEDLERHFRPNTKLVYMETIANPTCDVIDIRKVARSAHAHGCLLIVDNTFATPPVCRPLTLGADMVVYSATKFMSGHSDILAGVIVANQSSLIDHITDVGHSYGPIMSPFDAWLLIRSMRTLEIRLAQHSHSAMTAAEYFQNHKKVRQTLYSGLASSPSHQVAKETFGRGLFGGMVSIDLGTEQNVNDVIRNFKMVKLVPSLGAFSTTVSDTKTSHGAMTKEERDKAGLSDGLLRISIGLEDVEDIIEDFDQALKAIR